MQAASQQWHEILAKTQAMVEAQRALLDRGTLPIPARKCAEEQLATMVDNLALCRRIAHGQRGRWERRDHTQSPGTLPSPQGKVEVDVERLLLQERARLARDLHDTIGQHLCALRLVVKGIAAAPEDQRLQEQMALLEGLIAAADEDLDRTVFQLHPPGLTDDLPASIERHAQRWSSLTGIEVDLVIVPTGNLRARGTCAETVYRVVQEALTNVAKHAGATKVSISVTAHNHELSLSVEDDGRGFEAGAAQQPGGAPGRLGLSAMRERIEVIGGMLQIESSSGAGTTILVRVPLTDTPRT